MKYEIGQEVWVVRDRIKDVKIVDIDGGKYKCSFQNYTTKPYSSQYYWKDEIGEFYEFELRDTPFSDIKPIYTKSKWEDIIQRNKNTVMSLRRVYQDWLDGYIVVPEYQRGLVWTLKQKQRYIMNLYLEKAEITPTFILNWTDDNFEVVDGLQRLTSAFEFINNEYPLESGLYFRDLSQSDCNFLMNHAVRYTEIRKLDSSDLTLEQKIELFLEINELGTKMSDEHISKVKEMIR
ncbi:MAG: DUF262 domain-containing protein [Fusobacteriaceae bacterium]